MKRTKDFRDGFKTKKMGDGSVIVEGYANAATVDRGKEFVRTDAWDLENYKKVPMILFNHDPDKPIGRMMEIRPTDKGLYLKAKISKSKNQMVSYVRDLIEEGILNAFSVGFDTVDEQKNSEGVLEIKAAELYEVSVVTLPMNQDSLFNLSTKSFKGLEYKDVKKKVLRKKGANVAAALHGKIDELVNAGELDKAKLFQMVMEKAGVDQATLDAVLAGDAEPSKEVLLAFAEILGLDPDELGSLDENLEEKEDEPEEEKMEGDPEEEKNSKAEEEEPTVEPEEEKAEEPEEEKAVSSGVGVIAIQIPKDAVADAEAAGQWAKDNGWSASSVDENDSFFVVHQTDSEMYTEGEAALDLGDGVTALVGVKKSTTKECGDEHEEKMEDEELEEKMEDPDEEKSIQTKEAIAANDDGLPKMDENPMYQQVRQTNVLLGALIEEIKTMSQKLDKIVVSEPTEPEEVKMEEASEDEDEELTASEQKMLADAKIKLASLKDRLSQYSN